MANEKKIIDELDRYLRPHAVTAGTAVTREIVEIIRKWAAGEIEWNKASDKNTLAEAEKALASGAKWFAVTYVKGSHTMVKSLIPVTSVAEAKKLGFEPYEVPGFPNGYDPEQKVGEQQFTYGQLYASWRTAFEEMITAGKDNYPFYATLHGYPNYNAWESVECDCDDVEELFDQMSSGFSREIDAMCVDFYFNDPWNGQADPDVFTFHIEKGKIDSKYSRKFLPKGNGR